MSLSLSESHEFDDCHNPAHVKAIELTAADKRIYKTEIYLLQINI